VKVAKNKPIKPRIIAPQKEQFFETQMVKEMVGMEAIKV